MCSTVAAFLEHRNAFTRNVVQLNHSHRFSVFSLCGFLCIIQSFMLPAFSCIVSFLCCMDSARVFSKYEDHPAAFTSVMVHFVSNSWQVSESKRAVCVSWACASQWRATQTRDQYRHPSLRKDQPHGPCLRLGWCLSQ
jgi:hypothetical protein